MYKKLGAILLSFCFILITLAPSISILTETNYELIQLLDTSEEEEKNFDKNFEKEIIVFKLQEVYPTYIDVIDLLKVKFKHIDYPIPYLNLISPPPD